MPIPKTKEDIEQALSHPALTRVSGSLKEAIEPAIAVRPEAKSEGTGSKSIFAGDIWVPEKFVWPAIDERDLSAVVQFDLSEFPDSCFRGLLPKIGLLTFFLDLAGDPHDPRSSLVQLFGVDGDALIRQPGRLPKKRRWFFWEKPLEPKSISFESDWTLPDPVSAGYRTPSVY